ELAGAGGAEGMAEADRTAVDVELLVGDLADGLVPAQMLAGELSRGECPADGEDLGGESLVDVDHVDVLERQPRPVEGDRSRQRRPDEELPTRVDRRRGVGPDDRIRLVAEAAGG